MNLNKLVHSFWSINIVEFYFMERLYGLLHRPKLYFSLLNEYEVTPNEALHRELEALPAGTRIGLEFSPDLRRLSTGRHDIHCACSVWSEIDSVARKASLDVVYLEEPEIFDKYFQKGAEAERLLRKLNEAFNERADVAEQFLSEYYRAKVEADYAFVVEREARIIDKLVKTDPQVAVLYRSHGDYLSVNPLSLLVSNVQPGEYTIEHLPWDSSRYRSGSVLRRDLDIPAKEVIMQRESLQRKYNAVTQGRITSHDKPDGIGTWNVKCPAAGLFEIYIDRGSDRFEGTIEDVLGKATFVGEKTPYVIKMIKTYDSNRSVELSKEVFGETTRTLRGPIIYEGVMIDNEYKGRYVDPNTNATRPFNLQLAG